MAILCVVACTLLSTSVAHVASNWPPSWSDPDGAFGLKYGWRDAGCIPHTGRPGAQSVTGHYLGDSGSESDAKHCIMKWYTNFTFIPGQPTLPENMRTFKTSSPKNPWYAPGTAPVFSPCGIDGGNPHGCPVGNPDPFACAGGGRGHGDDGRTLKGNTKPVDWTIGSEEEVIYGVEANHGGGYQYRLCPKPENAMDLTEECFMKMPLVLGKKAWVQFNGDRNNRTEFTPLRTTTGTVPAGSQWSRNAIPACHTFLPGGGGVLDYNCITGGPQFTPPALGAYGFWGDHNSGNVALGWGRVSNVSIVDTLTVPDVATGNYVLQFRYDAEQTSQVWNSCADLRIKRNVIV